MRSACVAAPLSELHGTVEVVVAMEKRSQPSRVLLHVLLVEVEDDITSQAERNPPKSKNYDKLCIDS